MKTRTKYTLNTNVFPCFRFSNVYGMVQVHEISLRKWSGGTAQLNTLEQGLKHMWPVREFCAACDAFWNFK